MSGATPILNLLPFHLSQGMLIVLSLLLLASGPRVSQAVEERAIDEALVSLLQTAQLSPGRAPAGQALVHADLQGGRQQGRQRERQAPGEAPPKGSTKNFIIVYTIIWSVVIGIVAAFFMHLKRMYDEIAKGDDGEHTFQDYVSYRFTYWFVWTGYSKEKVLFGMCMLYMLVGSALYCAFVKSTMIVSVYQTFNMLVDPGGAQAQTTNAGQILGVPASLGGLVIFAVLLAVVQDRFTGYLDSIKSGSSPVVEAGHILVIGFSGVTMELLAELCLGFSAVGGKTIIVLSQRDKGELEDEIQTNMTFDLQGSKIVVRSGVSYRIKDLQRVSAHACKTIVLTPDLQDSAESRDAFIMQTLIALCSKGWPVNGRIIVTCSLPQNRSLLESLGGKKADVVMLQACTAKFLNRCSMQPGFGSIIRSMFGFEGSELHMIMVSQELVGKRFCDAARYFPLAVLLGLLSEDGSMLYPDRDYKLTASDELILLTEDEHTAVPELVPAAASPMESSNSLVAKSPFVRQKTFVRRPSPANEETVLIVGWHDVAGLLLFEIDQGVGPNSKVITYASKPVEEREEEVSLAKLQAGKELANIGKVEHKMGAMGSRSQLEALLASEGQDAHRIFLLSGEFEDARAADALTTTTLLQIRDALKDRKEPPVLVPQLRCGSTEALYRSLGLTDFVNCARVPAQMLANIVQQPRLAPVLIDLLSEGGHVNCLIFPITDFLSDGQRMPDEISFWELASIVDMKGVTLAGWTVPSAGQEERPQEIKDLLSRAALLQKGVYSDSHLPLEMNPADKSARRRWSAEDDRLIVVVPGTEET